MKCFLLQSIDVLSFYPVADPGCRLPEPNYTHHVYTQGNGRTSHGLPNSHPWGKPLPRFAKGCTTEGNQPRFAKAHHWGKPTKVCQRTHHRGKPSTVCQSTPLKEAYQGLPKDTPLREAYQGFPKMACGWDTQQLGLNVLPTARVRRHYGKISGHLNPIGRE